MLHLVDASVYIFRAWFSIPDSMTDPKGRPVNALYGYARFMCEFMQRAAPARVAVAFDESLTSSFRNDIYPAYKSNRELPPPELEYQLDACRRFTEALGIRCFASDTWEADDLIGTLAARAAVEGMPVTIVTRDKDLAQVVGEHDLLWDYAADKVLDRAGIHARYGVWPEQFVDLQALTGDAVDNIPGVAGVGAKSAVALLAHFGDLDQLYARLDEVPWMKLRGAKRVLHKLEAGRESAFLSRELARIVRDAPLDTTLDALAWSGIDRAALEAVLDEAGFGTRLREQALGLDPR